MAGKKYWRCSVCGDIHYGMQYPDPCPTCSTPNAYVEITAEDARKTMFKK